MSYGFNPGAVLGLLAGLATLALGIAVMRVQPRRRDAIWFAAFALTWGLFTCLLNVSLATQDVATLRPWVYAYVAVGIPLYVPLVGFVSAYPTTWSPLARNPVAAALVALPAALGLLLYASEPSLFVEGFVQDPPAPHRPMFGALGTVAAVFNTQFAFVLALGLLLYRLPRARDGTERAQLALVVAAFLAYVSYRAADVLQAGLLLARTDGWPWPLALRLVAASTALAGTVGAIWWTRRHGAPDGGAPWQGLLLACASVPLGMGLAEIVVIHQGIPGFRTDGLWRLGTVALFAYALARTRLFDLDLQVRQGTTAAAYVLVPTLALLAMWTALDERFTELPALGAAASLGLTLVTVGSVRVGARWFERATPLDDRPYRTGRVLEAYKTVVREVEDLNLPPSERDGQLDRLRERLDLDREEHRTLVNLARLEVTEPRQAGPMERFEQIEELGRGGFGRAVLARDRVLEREVVLKEPRRSWLASEDTRERFLQEARLAAGVSHPNVVTLYEVLTDLEPPLLVFEYVDGGSLRELLDQRAPLSLERSLAIAADVLDGLDALHEAGIVHRDVKPGNVLLDRSGQALLADLGAAKPPDALASDVTLAASEQQVGSLGYMSPEQTEGREADARADLYSVAALLYRCLTGEHYIELANVPDAIARKRTRERAPRLPRDEIPEPVEQVLRKALSKDPDERFGSAAAMRQALDEARAQLEGVSARVDTGSEDDPR